MRQVRVGSVVPMVRNLGLFFSAVLVVFFAMFAGQFPNTENPYVTALSSKYYYDRGTTVLQSFTNSISNEALETILKMELPALSLADDLGSGLPRKSSQLLRMGLNLLAGVKLEDPLTYLRTQIPMMKMTPVMADSFDEASIDEISEKPSQNSSSDTTLPQTEIQNVIKSTTPLIALYNTHTSETYELTDGLAHIKGEAGGITQVSREIQEVIAEEYGIATTYSSTLHDVAFNKSYIESEKTIKQLIKETPGLEMVFDIHRDANMTREQSITKIDGKHVAKILIVVGTDARADHPNWRENLDFARKIAAKMDSMYPGLSRGIAIKQGRYNQHHSNRALLLEIGSSKNSTDEAVASGRLFANVVVAVLNDMKSDQLPVASDQ